MGNWLTIIRDLLLTQNIEPFIAEYIPMSPLYLFPNVLAIVWIVGNKIAAWADSSFKGDTRSVFRLIKLSVHIVQFCTLIWCFIMNAMCILTGVQVHWILIVLMLLELIAAMIWAIIHFLVDAYSYIRRDDVYHEAIDVEGVMVSFAVVLLVVVYFMLFAYSTVTLQGNPYIY